MLNLISDALLHMDNIHIGHIKIRLYRGYAQKLKMS